MQVAFGSYIVTVTEVVVDGDGQVRVRRIVAAVDAGVVINPDTIVAQLQGEPDFRSDRSAVWAHHGTRAACSKATFTTTG